MQPPRTREGEQGLPQSLNMETWVEHFRRPQPKSGRTRGGWMKRLWLRKKNTPPPLRKDLDATPTSGGHMSARGRAANWTTSIRDRSSSGESHTTSRLQLYNRSSWPPILGMCQPLARSRHKSARGAGLHLRAVQNGSGDGGVPEVQGIPLAISGR